MDVRSIVVAVALAAVMSPGTAAGQDGPETLIAPLRGGPQAAVSSRDYAGEWWLMVKGGGAAAGTQVSDAFFVFTTSDGAILPPPGVIGLNEPHPWHASLQYNWVLSLNGASADALVIPGVVPTLPGSAVPEYNPAHVYVFPIAAPGGPLTIGVNDIRLEDNLGAYEVTIGTRTQALTAYADGITQLMSQGYIWGEVTLPGNDLHVLLQRATRNLAAGAEADARADLEAVLRRLEAEEGVTIRLAFAATVRMAIVYLLRLF